MGSRRRRGQGGLIGSPAPGGSGEGPRPARGAAPFHSPPCPSLPAALGRECLVPAAPSPGPEGRAGRAASYPLLLPISSPPRCEPEPPPPLPPLTHAAPGLAQRRVWDRVRGWKSLVESGRAGAIWRPCPERASAPPRLLERAVFSSATPAGERRPLAKAVGTELLAWPQGKGLRTCGKVIPFPDPCQLGFLSGRGE